MNDQIIADRRMLEALVCPLTQGLLNYDADGERDARIS